MTDSDNAHHRGSSSPSVVASGLATWADRSPHREALSDATRTLDFAELREATAAGAEILLNRIALPPGSYLPIIVGRNASSVVALHAATWAGMPYAVIDESTPRLAVSEQLTRLGSPGVALTTSAEHAGLLPNDIRIVKLGIERGSGVEPQPVRPTDAAVVLFTSGSTGRPKGVVFDWAGIDGRQPARFAAMAHDDPLTRTPILTSLGFITGLGTALLPASGPAISILDPLALSPVELLEEFDRRRLTIIPMVPSLAVELGSRWPAGRRLEHVVELSTFGEQLVWEVVEDIRRLIPVTARIVTKYGSTEAAGEVLRMTIPSDEPLGTGRVPLGVVTGTRTARLEDADASGSGELVVGEPLAMGYLDDDSLTAARFVTDDRGLRLWRTGDRLRRSDDGLFVNVGRKDDLVKIRGNLVEPAEPERVLRSLHGIREAVVIPHPAAGDGSPQLVAHLLMDSGCALTPDEVRRSLESRLRPHQVPAILVRHEAFPRTTSGKVDRVRLLSARPAPWITAAARPAQSDAERFVTAAATQVLGGHEVHADDDLLELGLDSLAAVELVLTLEEAGWPPFDAPRILEARTPAALALLRDQARLIRESDAVVLNADGQNAPLFCVAGAGGTALPFSWLAAALAPDQPVVVIEDRGLHTRRRPARSVEQAADHVLGVIRTLQPRGMVALAGYSAGGAIAYETAVRLAAQGRQAAVAVLDGAIVVRGSAAPEPDPAVPRPVGLEALRRRWERARLWMTPATSMPRHRRYRAYYDIGVQAQRRYRASPSTVEVRLLQIRGSSLDAAWREVTPNLSVHEVGGDHHTLLFPPHVAAIATQMRELSSLTGTAGPTHT